MLLAKSAAGQNKAETLLEHSRQVVLMARKLCARLPLPVKADESLNADLEAAAAVHDIGKAAVGFQEMLKGKRPNWNGWRHEALSAAFASNLRVAEEVIFAVLTHHRQIPGSVLAQDGGRLRWQGILPTDWLPMLREWEINESSALEFWRQLCLELGREDLSSEPNQKLTRVALDPAWLNNKPLRKQDKFISASRRVRTSLLRGLLMGADHLASAGHQELPEPINLAAFSPNFPLRDFQKNSAVKGHLILRAPTGSGKTEASLVWAAKNQVENGRFFYTLPYTAALNAMYMRLQQAFPNQESSIGLLHGRAAHHLYTSVEQDFPTDKARATAEAQGRARLAKEMYFPVRVCTPHQLLRFSLRGKGWEQMLAEIPGSCIVFDEVHSYDPALAGQTLATARLFASMGARLMFISATLPHFLQKKIQELIPATVQSPDPTSESDQPILNRKRHIVQVVRGNLENLLPRMEEEVRSGRKILVVCNHVRSAQILAKALRASLSGSRKEVCLFHSRFNMRDRKTKETVLSSDTLPDVLVATQVIEVSLDISFDVGFFEPAPIDALAQRMGRVNRKGLKPPASISIANEQMSSHKLYNPEWTHLTLQFLADITEPISEQDLTAICDVIYQHGYTGEDQRTFEERLNSRMFTHFEEKLVAGEHENWIDQVIERENGRADVLPLSLASDYRKCMEQKRWLDADALLINTYTANLSKYINANADPWTINLPYSEHNGLEVS